MNRGEEIVVRIEKLDSTGKGVAKPEGFVVFVPGGIPGQKLKIRIEKKKHNYAEGSIVEVLEKSQVETNPLCSAFPVCGGCTWQTIPYKEQVRIKEELVRETLLHIGKLDIPVLPILPSPQNLYYRNKMEFTFGLNEKNEPIIGMHERGDFSRIVETNDCILMSPESSKILSFFSQFVREFNLPVYDPKTHQGLFRHLIIREGKNTGERMVNLVTTSSNLIAWPDDLMHQFATFQDREGIQVHSFLHTINERVSDIAVGEKINVWRGRNYITERIENLLFKISPYSFFQTNTSAASVLYQKVMKMVEPQKEMSVLDLYCGTGGIGLYIAKEVKSVLGVDSFPQAIEDAQENAGLNDILNAGFFLEEVKNFVAKMVKRREHIDVIILDPPREGLNPRIIKGISLISPEKVIYVSCNPATMVRDLVMFRNFNFKPKSIQPLDLFPHTPHIECIADLENTN